MKRICEFLCIPYERLEQKHLFLNIKKNQNDYPNELDKLNYFYKPYNESLYKLIGKKFDW